MNTTTMPCTNNLTTTSERGQWELRCGQAHSLRRESPGTSGFRAPSDFRPRPHTHKRRRTTLPTNDDADHNHNKNHNDDDEAHQNSQRPADAQQDTDGIIVSTSDDDARPRQQDSNPYTHTHGEATSSELGPDDRQRLHRPAHTTVLTPSLTIDQVPTGPRARWTQRRDAPDVLEHERKTLRKPIG